tara:strand:+ start:184 stop:720 length:537 start_codon:yes stop_codon:yes gene_type:complete
MKEIIGDDYPTYEESVNMTLADRAKKGHYVCNIPATDFTDDEEKMADFHRLTKQEFLDSYSYLTEEEYNLTMNQIRLLQEEKDISKNNTQRLLRENLELRHRLSCIADDIELIDRHIKNNCNKKFKKPSLNADGTIYADEAWHNVSNIEIACDLNDDEPLHWGSKVKSQLDEKLNEQN